MTINEHDAGAQTLLVEQVSSFVKLYMANYDASHDYSHILRVVSLAHHIASSSQATTSYDLHRITLAALLHDVGDKKYLQPGEDAKTMVRNVLKGFGAEEGLATTVQTICTHVSYSSEVKDPEAVRQIISKIPELAVVQDADRLDAIGAIGIGRTFTFGGAKNKTASRGGGRGMEETIDHFTEKLELLEGMMKTEPGRMMARERTERLQLFRVWWEEENAGVDSAKDIPGVRALSG